MRLTKPKTGEPIRLVSTRNGETRYQVCLTSTPRGTKNRQQVRRNFRTLTEARSFVDKTRSAVREGVFTASDATTLAELAEQWLSTRRDIREVSQHGYRQVLKPILAAHGDRRVQSVTRADVEAWVGSWRTAGGMRGRGLSHRSVVYSLGALRQLFAFGVDQGLLAKNAAADVRAPRKRAEDKAEVEVWRVEKDAAGNVRVPDLERFLAHVDGLEDLTTRAGMQLTAAGLRRSEVLGLDWAALNLGAGTVTIRQSRVKVGRAMITETDDPKSKASRRTIPLQAATRAALRELWLARGRPEAGLVVTDAAGMGIDPDVYSSRFRELCRASGVTPIRLHAVRHSIATAMHEADEPPAAVARYLGHELATHIAYYVVSTDDSAARVAARFGAIMAAASSS